MRDLIRSYRMKLRRKPSMSDTDDTESQPLASSISSANSFGTLTEPCIFPNDYSDVTDYECAASDKPSSTPKSLLRRPFGGAYPTYDSPDVYTASETIYDRLQYFTPNTGLRLVDEATLLPKKVDLLASYKELDDDFRPATASNTQSSLVTIFAIWNTIMGTSLLAIAWGLEKAGLIPGLLLIVSVAGICLYTAYVILKVNEEYGFYEHNDVSDLCRLLLGRWAEILAKVFSLVVLIGANIVYWILMSNFLYNSVFFVYDYIFGVGSGGWQGNVNATTTTTTSPFGGDVLCNKELLPPVVANLTLLTDATPLTTFERWWNLYSTVPIILCLFMFPILNFRSATFFTKFNSLGTISVAYLLLVVFLKALKWGINISEWSVEFEIKATFSALSGMLSLSFFIHNIIISICRNNKHQENNGRDLSIAFLLVTFTYLFVGVTFYVSFPLAKTCIEDNILNNLPKSDGLAIVARVLLLFQLFTVFPLISYMLRMDIMSNVRMMCAKYAEFAYWKVIALNVGILIICTLFACFLPRIGTLIRYTGALSGMVFIFTLPSLLKIAALRKENSLTPFQLIVHVAIVILGAINLGAQFFINDQ